MNYFQSGDRNGVQVCDPVVRKLCSTLIHSLQYWRERERNGKENSLLTNSICRISTARTVMFELVV